jgi:immunity protein Imm1 of predicted polymorphic toxin system
MTAPFDSAGFRHPPNAMIAFNQISEMESANTDEPVKVTSHPDGAAIPDPLTLQWSESEPAVTFPNCLELDRAIHKIASRTSAQRPIIVAVYGRRYQIGVGVGLPQSFVSIQCCDRARLKTGLITVGDAQTQGEAVFFFLNTRRTEIRRRHLIPATQARQILREFLKTGFHSTAVGWEVL